MTSITLLLFQNADLINAKSTGLQWGNHSHTLLFIFLEDAVASSVPKAIKYHLSCSGKRCAKGLVPALGVWEINTAHLSDSAWCLHTPMWTGAGKNSWSIWNISLKIKAQNYLLLWETIRCHSFFKEDLPRCSSLLRSAGECFCTKSSLLVQKLLWCLTKVVRREEHAHLETRTGLRKVVWWVLKNLRDQSKKLLSL